MENSDSLWQPLKRDKPKGKEEVFEVKSISEVLTRFLSTLLPSGFSPGYLSLAPARRSIGGRTCRPCGAWQAAAACTGLCGQM